MSVAAQRMRTDLDWSEVQKGYVLVGIQYHDTLDSDGLMSTITIVFLLLGISGRPNSRLDHRRALRFQMVVRLKVGQLLS